MKSILVSIVAAVLVVGCCTPAPEPPTSKAPHISIIRAAGTGNIEAVQQHLDAGVDVNTKNKQGRTPLSAATTTEIAELLIANGADVKAKTTKGRTPLHNADTKGIAELLIAKGANVNALILSGSDQGKTPLDTADNKEIADLLRKHGGKTGAELKAEGN
jgi:ankyrin repeat protein